MTHTITSQNIDLSSWITLYFEQVSYSYRNIYIVRFFYHCSEHPIFRDVSRQMQTLESLQAAVRDGTIKNVLYLLTSGSTTSNCDMILIAYTY